MPAWYAYGFAATPGSEEQCLDAIEHVFKQKAAAGNHKWLVSDECSLADLSMMPQFACIETCFTHNLANSPKEKTQKMWHALQTEDRFAAYREWWSLAKERESFKKTNSEVSR